MHLSHTLLKSNGSDTKIHELFVQRHRYEVTHCERRFGETKVRERAHTTPCVCGRSELALPPRDGQLYQVTFASGLSKPKSLCD